MHLLYTVISLSQADTAISGDIFTCQADFQGNIYNATKLCHIGNNDNLQQIEFSEISVGLRDMQVLMTEY